MLLLACIYLSCVIDNEFIHNVYFCIVMIVLFFEANLFVFAAATIRNKLFCHMLCYGCDLVTRESSSSPGCSANQKLCKMLGKMLNRIAEQINYICAMLKNFSLTTSC